MEIKNLKVGENEPPFIIAELSANHGGSIERAKASILAAKNSGVSAVKLQTYTPDTITIDCDKDDFLITEGIWTGLSLYDLYKDAHTPFEWHKELFAFAKKNKIILFSTPFDNTAVDLLESLDVPAYKIASFELNDLDLIKYVAKKQKPILLSTGMATIEEIAQAVEIIEKTKNQDYLLFHCISNYPTKDDDSHINNIKHLQKEFGCLVGLSDHTTSNFAAILAIANGAVAIEKHFKLDTLDCGPDASFSLLPSELKSLVLDCQKAKKCLGKGDFSRSREEKANLKYRRSLYFTQKLNAGSKISAQNIRSVRPGFGLDPKYYEEILGRRICCDVEKGDRVTWNCIEE